jgi:4,5:9,10-diseco-3-hydroxy-5,9,17-trioxoandrosta-1(10),2-diene-4-oate hydrolase
MDVQEVPTTVRGVELWHREAGSGYPVVLLHGGGGTGKAFWHQLQGLSHRFRVIAPDLPGFGRSAWVPGVTRVDELWPVLWDWLDRLGVDRCMLGGNSMGGRVALAAAIGAPHRVSHLVLLDAVGVILPDLPPRNPLDIPPSQFMTAMVHDVDHYRKVTPYRTLEDAEQLNRGRQAFAQYLSHGPIGPDRSAELPRATMPTLLIWGREDRIVPLPYGRALAERMPRAELVVLENTGHLPHIEAADLVTHLIADFYDRFPPEAP